MIRFTASDQITQRVADINTCLRTLIDCAEQGIRPPKQTHSLDLPTELIDAFNSDPELAAAFHALTPGRQRSYALNLNAAKKPETRIARILKFRDKIIAGKGATER
ncbi:MAG: hypothetical protein Alpg2KO_27410 [Alphaproteobacteria bacterium]